jgi:hypothetical protein
MDTGGWRLVGNGEDEQLMLALGLQSKRAIALPVSGLAKVTAPAHPSSDASR